MGGLSNFICCNFIYVTLFLVHPKHEQMSLFAVSSAVLLTSLESVDLSFQIQLFCFDVITIPIINTRCTEYVFDWRIT